VCRHRAGPVATGCGQRQTLQCRYHGWTYALEGTLIRAPEMEGVHGFVPEQVRLVPVRVARWGPLVFANLDNGAPPLDDFLGTMPEDVQGLGFDGLRYVTRKEYEVACNWKTYIDNYLEGYHVPHIHPGLYRELDYDGYRVEPRGYYSIQHAPLREASSGATRHYRPEPGTDEARYFWLFPNVMLNVYFGLLQTNIVLPLDVERTLTVFEWYAREPPRNAGAEARFLELFSFSDEIQVEDIAICETVQKNLRSGVYERGRYSLKRENGVHHFHRLLAEFGGDDR
jgi:choline monooxygenase